MPAAGGGGDATGGEAPTLQAGHHPGTTGVLQDISNAAAASAGNPQQQQPQPLADGQATDQRVQELQRQVLRLEQQLAAEQSAGRARDVLNAALLRQYAFGAAAAAAMMQQQQNQQQA